MPGAHLPARLIADERKASGKLLAGVALSGGDALLQLHDGTLVSVRGSAETDETRWRTLPGFPEPCPDMRATPAGASNPGDISLLVLMYIILCSGG